jgi:hypothetical protein
MTGDLHHPGRNPYLRPIDRNVYRRYQSPRLMVCDSRPLDGFVYLGFGLPMPMDCLLPIFPPRARRALHAACRGFCALAVMLAVFAHIPAAKAADMTDVHKEIDSGRLFDAFRDLTDLAKQGNAEAQYELGGFYHWGRVGAANFPKARDWYQRSANQGNVDAMIGLAVMNGYGQGGPVDKRTAVKWLTIASDTRQLPPDAVAKIAEKRDELADDLSPADLSAITAEAKAFKPKPEN